MRNVIKTLNEKIGMLREALDYHHRLEKNKQLVEDTRNRVNNILIKRLEEVRKESSNEELDALRLAYAHDHLF